MTTLARLSFEVHADHLDPFEIAYERQLAPILQRHGLEPTTEGSRPLAALKNLHDFWSFSRLFAVESPKAVSDRAEVLKHDPAWQQAVQELAPDFGRADCPFIYYLSTHHNPAGPGRTVPAGPGQTVRAGRGDTVTVGSGFRQGPWHSLGLLDGMPAHIRSLVHDRHGDLWFGSSLSRYGYGRHYPPGAGIGPGSGLWRYDGGRLHRFTAADGLPHNDVICLVEDPAEPCLWIGTRGGLCRYDGHTFQTFTVQDGLVGSTVGSLLIDRCGNLWIGTEGGASCYDGACFTNLSTRDGLTHDAVSCMLEDGAGRLWFGGGWDLPDSRGVSRYDGHVFTNFSDAEGLANNWVLSLLEDQSGRVWVGHSNSVSCYDGQSFETALVTDNSQHTGGVTSMLEDREGHLWFAVAGEGLRRYDGHTYVHFTCQDGLADLRLADLLEDGEGQIWVGTEGGGLSRYTDRRLRTLTTEDGLGHNEIGQLLEDRDGRLWIGTDRGVSVCDGANISVLEGTTDRRTGRLLESRAGALFFGLKGMGVGRWDGRQVEIITTASAEAERHWDYELTPLLEDRRGRLWFAAGGEQGHLKQWDGEAWTSFAGEIGVAHHQVTCMLE